MTNNEIIPDLKDPDGWTVENNPHPAPDYVRSYPNKKMVIIGLIIWNIMDMVNIFVISV